MGSPRGGSAWPGVLPEPHLQVPVGVPLDRRRFTAGVAGFLLAGHARDSFADATGPALRKPQRLKQGDVVGLVSPSGVLDDALAQRAVVNLEAMGFRVKPSPHLRAARGGYAGTVAERVGDLHAMFADREVRAIWAARGGSGCSALLPHVDFALVRRNPKAVVGFSDLTSLHLALLRRADLVAFHGPVATSANSAFSRDQALAVLTEPAATRVLPLAEDSATRAAGEPQFRPRTYRDGVASGRLAGGNLSVLCAALGTPYVPR